MFSWLRLRGGTNREVVCRAPLYYVLGALLIGTSSVQKIFDPDLFWHVAVGRWLANVGWIPTTDPFSFTSDRPWRFSEALFDLFAWALWDLGGPTLFQIGWAVVIASWAAVVLRYIAVVHVGATPGVALWTLGLVASASAFRFGPTADVFSYIGAGVVLIRIVQAERRNDARVLWMLPAVAAVWPWFHRGVLMAPALLGMSAGLWLIRRETRRLVPSAVLVAVACTAVIWLHPGARDVFAGSFDLTTRSSFRLHFAEWRAMPADFVVTNPALGVVALSWGASWIRHRRFLAMDVVALALSVVAISSVRFTPFATMALAARVALCWGDVARTVGSRLALRQSVRDFVGTAGVLGLVLATYLLRLPSHHFGFGIAYWRVPTDAAEWLRSHPPPGRGWNDFDAGGALLNALGPHQQVAIDGRNDTVYTDATFSSVLGTEQQQASFDAFVAQHDVKWALVSCRKIVCEQMPWVLSSPRWWLVYADDAALIFVRADDAETAQYREQLAFRALRPDAFARLESPKTPPEERALLAEETVELVQRAPRSLRALLLATLAMKVTGRPADYERFRADYLLLAASRNVSQLPP